MNRCGDIPTARIQTKTLAKLISVVQVEFAGPGDSNPQPRRKRGGIVRIPSRTGA